MSSYRTVIIGNESLAIQCSEMLRDAGHSVGAIITRNPDVADWAKAADIPVIASDADLAHALAGINFDWLLSIANLDMIPDAVLALPARGAVNFHDGPLPRYAGLNAPVWALLSGELEYGISWHMIAGGIDEGGLLAQRFFEVAPDETVLTLNTKCYAAAIDSFETVIDKLGHDAPVTTDQDLSQRSYFAKYDRPANAARLDFTQSARKITTFVRALDHGDYWNPLTCPKIATNTGVFLVARAVAETSGSDAAPGTVIAVSTDSITIATATAPVTLRGLRDAVGGAVTMKQVARVGEVLSAGDTASEETRTAALKSTLKYEASWRKTLAAMPPSTLPLIDMSAEPGDIISLALLGDAPDLAHALAHLGDALSDDPVYLALAVAHDHPGYLNDWVPVQSGDDHNTTKLRGPFAADLRARIPGGVMTPALGLSDTGHISGTALTVAGNTLHADTGKLSACTAKLTVARLNHMAAQIARGDTPSVMSDAERQTVLYDWNATAKDFPTDVCIHQAFEAQVTVTPDAEAIACEGESLSYAQLNARANSLAHLLRENGVGPDVIVGLHLPRSTALLIGALAIMKAGGAYLPMDPDYPADRTAHYIKDSGTKVIVTDSTLATGLPQSDAKTVLIDTLPEGGDTANPDSGVTGAHLAYMIYTSGSTGKPKGVMIEHRNVANFFVGMDDRIAHDPPGIWMAITSLSFDISILELFWTLARGFKLVMSGDENRALVAGDSGATGVGMEFSLFYWGNDDGVGRDKYRSLLEGAQFADKNGFCAVWTPERHFHAFGGPYPNPSVTGAAVAAVTQNIAVRAGSCVAPLHHTARIAEEWAVIDNLTNGRTGLAIASGWQPDDFVLRPENTPPLNKPAMFDAIRDLRKLWAGETVEFARADGEMHGVVTQPRPVSKKLNVWVTTAGNPDTWKEAGTHGCNVLTHLLGQSVDEVAQKIVIYHAALRAAGHDPDDFTVTLMLHSFLSDTRDRAREIAREPMKDYLRAAAGLIKQYAWAFPAFKKPKGVENPTQIDLGSLDEEEMDGILEFAFERYFNDSGLFGTVEDAIARVEQVKAIGVTEIACLIDYGIDVDQVLDGLKPLARVVADSNKSVAQDDYSIAAQIIRHKVTHLQCTPSMAQMLTMNDDARAALAQVKHLFVGGEALSGALVDDLHALTGGQIENMYGPTETTIWSTTQTAEPGHVAVPIGTPIANTQVYVLDDLLEPCPIGVAGAMYIAGAGVARGYFQRADLTSERFLPDPFGDGRMYNTGDLARWRSDGRLEFLGRADFQLKLRGYRIELGEIESVISQHTGVQQALVVAREDTPGLVQLVAYLVADRALDETALRNDLRKALPDYMVPKHFVTLAAIPLTPNKKIDRAALPAPAIGQLQPTRRAATPSPSPDAPTPMSLANSGSEADISDQISAIWSAMLGVPQVGSKDSFFDLGGHSLLAVQAHREIREKLGVPKLTIIDIFRAPTLGALSKIVAQKKGLSDTPTKPLSSPAPATQTAEPITQPLGEPLQDAMARRREMRERRRNR